MFSAQNSQGVSADVNYIEDMFSTWLYTGNGSSQTITNGIDLAGKGGLVWVKHRSNVNDHILVDTIRGVNQRLSTNNSASQTVGANPTVTAFSSTGFSLGNSATVNNNTGTFVAWTFREQPKFFDIVTYTGNGVQGNAIPHSLGSVPGCIIIKQTSSPDEAWPVYHRSLGAGGALYLNGTGAAFTGLTGRYPTVPTSTEFYVGNATDINASGKTYVAYIFAHDAGGFGLTATDNVVSCGIYTGNSSANGPIINLGYEPQWVLIKRASGGTANWVMYDNMRGMTADGSDAELFPNSSTQETTSTRVKITATGFQPVDTDPTINNVGTYIYIAIRRGPMKVPTDATKVFAPVARTGTGSVATVNVGFAPDFLTTFYRADAGQDHVVFDRLRGSTQYLNTAATTQEINVSTNGLISFNNTSFTTNANGYANNVGSSFSNWVFGRAPNFFDEVCYTGTATIGNSQSHNLMVAPELIIFKGRSTAFNWFVAYTFTATTYDLMYLDGVNSKSTNNYSANDILTAKPTISNFITGDSNGVNASAAKQVAYLFATCPGVSKVGSYTGNGSTQTINCGFTGGARFVLIKRTDSTGDWYVYDTARGMTTLTDPYLRLNSTAAESATLGSVTTVTTGFALNASILAAINASGGSYIFLAIA